ncbi:ATP-binding protein [Arcobacter sp. LA11]|uniref:ATP-binding protein n=1 Tax=Arcobacter sp. LA11 TaxID=1898176 RepID=UPI0009336C25|nr:ATP-binding protein [Arcobacter sp. LA11]
MGKTKLVITLLLYILISIGIFLISYKYIQKEEKSLLKQKYSQISNHMKKNLSTLIEDKKNATLAFAISAAKDKKILNALLTKDSTNINLKPFSLELREKTNFKNVWFQILDEKGKSFYRSWSKTKKDSLLFRADVKNILKKKEIQTSISVGRYDMTFKSMIPIFSEGNMVGILEIITHFNSITKILENDKIDSIVLADKQHKDKLTYPFTKKFIGDYYIANLNAKDYLIDTIKKNNLEKILKIKDYKLIDEKLLTTFSIIELNKDVIGYVIMTKKLKDINLDSIKSFKISSISYVVMFIIIIGFLISLLTYYLYSNSIKKLNNELKENLKKIKLQESRNQIILDSQKNIIVITDGEKLQNANKELLVFFDDYKSLDDYKKDYDCICETFIEMLDDSYVIEKDYDGKNWAEYILDNPTRKFKAAIKRKEVVHHFTLNVNLSSFEDENKPYIIVTLTDITQEIKQHQKLKSLNDNLELIVDFKTKELKQLNDNLEKKISIEIKKSKEKDRLIFQQNKMASMGEMLENIAHQWRQPLTSISTAASSIKLQKELNILNNQELVTSCDFILKNSQYLSQTIEDFKDFFKQDKEKQEFLIKESILENIALLKDKLKHNNIQLHLDIAHDEKLLAYKNEFQQAILNIINNSIDAFISNNCKSKKLIIIDYKNNTLTFQDSAGGVEENIINKIFEPYFTTKHQSQGTGIGLYMTREILVKHMNCTLNIKNEEFNYENEKYKGLKFTIIFN